jgi:large subunit ribosomal protein L30
MAKSLAVKQTHSTIGAQTQHKRTIKALGLGRIGKTRQLPDNPSVRGMLHHVRHLVEVTEEE